MWVFIDVLRCNEQFLKLHHAETKKFHGFDPECRFFNILQFNPNHMLNVDGHTSSDYMKLKSFAPYLDRFISRSDLSDCAHDVYSFLLT